MTAQQAAVFLRAFGDGTRLRIVAVLAKRELAVTQLADLLRCPEPRVSRHLAYLRARGLVESRRAGGYVLYGLAAPRHGLHETIVPTLLGALRELADVGRDTARLRPRAARG